MKANELRIGNWLRSAESFKQEHREPFYFQVSAEDIVSIWEGHSYAQPIPLTPEILEMAGFEKSPTNGFYVNNAMWLEVTPPFTPIYCDGTGFRRYIGKCLKYLHQLQNLYFALTWEELEINLK